MIDNFADSNFSSNPEWIGHIDRFIVNASGELQLQHNSPETNNTAYLSVAAATSINENTTWEFYIRMAFAASTTNFGRVYLMASQPDLSGNLNGYYLKIGGISGNNDSLELYRQDGGTSQLLLGGAMGKAGTDPVLARVRVTRTTAGEWTLFADYEGGTNFQTEGSAADATYATGNYFGFYCRYTSTRNQAFFFDDVSVDPLFMDTTPPILLNAEAISATEVELNFDEPLDANSAQNVNNYNINNNIGNPKSAILVAPTTIFLELNSPLQSGQTYTLTSNNVADLGGNRSMNQTATLIFFDIQTMMPGDVIINEILFNPETGGSDFVELYNISNKIFNLNGLEIENQQKTSGDTLQVIKTDFFLLPGAYVAIAEDSKSIGSIYNVPNLEALLDNNLPTFDDDKGNVTIRFAGATIDSFDYSDDLHFALLDDDEGVSLERLSPTTPTQSNGNWHSAASTVGFATPGYQNSQFFTSNNNTNKIINLSNSTFSPDGDGFEDVLIIEYNADQPGLSVNIRIFDAQGRMVKRLIDNESLAAQGSFKWDGTTDDATKARIGIYIIWTELFSPGGRVEQNKLTCVLAGKLD
ncbi:MAG: lamin tail domain-containing protein [Saprospiraceae bacterium]|nr:lamin tail domain-containing protein [Saprospiraceae bacterium]